MNLEIFKELLDNIQRKGLASDRSINAFWRYQLERLAPCLSDFDSDLSNITSEQIESILQALAYDQERVSQSLNTEMLIDFATNVLPKQQKVFTRHFLAKSETSSTLVVCGSCGEKNC
ncbi:hypothetical protein [Methylomonas sp. CM2]|uniref:hypothetical protein n=1 Tax=Methylomonas sp. CM2 TaxID=3417647 RepID=UPI003CF88361